MEFRPFRDIEGTCMPRYDGLSIVNIPNTILKHFGLPVRGPCLLREIESCILTEKIILVVLDGLVYKIVDDIVQEIEYMLNVKISKFKITSTFPSTTPTALTSLATGVEPSIHGVIGCVMYIREIGMLINTLNLSPQLRSGTEEQGPRDVLLKMGIDVTQLFNIGNTIFHDLSENGVRTLVLVNRGLKNGISRLIYRGAEIQEYSSYVEALIQAVSFLSSIDYGFVYIYNAVPDEVAHRRGTSGYEYYETVRELLYATVRIVKGYAAVPMTVIVTTDHGLVDSGEHDLIDMMMFRQLLNVLDTPPYGESRASHIKILPEWLDKVFEIEDVRLIRDMGFYIATRDEIIQEGLLGQREPDNKVKQRIGDLILLSTSSRYLRYSYNLQEREKEPLKATHGSILEDEMIVPLLIFNV